jgi:catechol 2,3-dioxygenase-like lactoylglutathione lyase family enzyme
MAIKLNGLNHYAIAVSDLSDSLTFYRDILGMAVIDRPDFDFEGAWLDCGNGIAIHLIVQTHPNREHSGSRSLHFAFAVDNIQGTKLQLLSKGITIARDIKPRPDGILQMFIQDPDNYFIEFNEI